MAATARMSPNWAWRMVLLTAAFGGFAVWCLYDARLGYPRFNERAAAYNGLVAEGRSGEWPAVAETRGWNPRFRASEMLPDGRVALKTPWDIGTQYVMLAASLAIVALALARLLRARRRCLRADDEGFLTVEGRLVPYADITDIDLRLWQRKSIARVRFRCGARTLTTAIDDWVYRGGEAVLAEIQRRTGLPRPSQDTGGGDGAQLPLAGTAPGGGPDGSLR